MKNLDFSQQPTIISPYNFGDMVTRENFINFLIMSYAVSRGNFVIQKVFFEMMRQKIGFQYELNIENLYNSGSFQALSKEEQNTFTQAFRSVKKHLEEFIEMEIDDEIRDEFDGLYDRPKTEGSIAFNTALNFFDFNQINSVSDFLKVSSEFNKRFENSLN